MWACEFWWMCPEKICTRIFQGILIFIFDFTDQYHLFTNTDFYLWHQISPTSGERLRFSIVTVLHQHFTARGSSSYAPVRAPPFTHAPHPIPHPAMRSDNQESLLVRLVTIKFSSPSVTFSDVCSVESSFFAFPRLRRLNSSFAIFLREPS